MSVTRVPTGAELRCLVCLKPASEIHHVEVKGMGGSKERDVPTNKVPICGVCHSLVHDKRIYMRMRDGEFQWRSKGKDRPWLRVTVTENKRHKCMTEAGSAAAEGADTGDDLPVLNAGSHPDSESFRAAPPASGGGGGAEAVAEPIRAETELPGNSATARPFSGETSAGELRVVVEGEGYQVGSPAPFSFERWKEEGEGLANLWNTFEDASIVLRWKTGDWFNNGERHLSEEVYGHAAQLGFSEGVLRHCSWVAAKVNADTRVFPLKWTYYRHVAALPAPQQKEMLAKAQEEHLTSRELYREIHGKKESPSYTCPECGHTGSRAEFKEGT